MIKFIRLIKFTVFQRNTFAWNYKCCTLASPKRGLSHNALELSKPHLYFPCVVDCRFSHSFFSRVTSEQLWKGVTSVSNAGRKKGRGKGMGKKMMQDLNKGQVIGFGKKNMLWPGLNAPIIRGKEIIAMQELPPDGSREQRMLEMRDQMTTTRRRKLHTLERGWTGDKLPGRSLGPPDPVGDEMFEGFDSRVVMFRTLMRMTAKRGRTRKMQALVVVGNKNGLVGYAMSKSSSGSTSAISAKNRAANVLRYVQRYKDHTVLHDFHSTYGAITVFVEQRPEGSGIRSHRVIKAICEMVGIKDLYAKVEGNTKHIIAVTRAFMIGLMQQRTHQQLADSMGLHLIEMRSEKDNFPQLMASPAKCRTEAEIGLHESTSFEEFVHNGKVVEPRKEKLPFFFHYRSYKKRLRDNERMKLHREGLIRTIAKYGKLESYLTIREAEKVNQSIQDSVEEGLK